MKAAAVAACERLGRYRMPFAWTAIHLSGVIGGGGGDTDSTGSAGSLDRKSGGLEQWRKKVETPTRRGSLERRSSDKRRSWSPDDFANCLDTFRYHVKNLFFLSFFFCLVNIRNIKIIKTVTFDLFQAYYINGFELFQARK